MQLNVRHTRTILVSIAAMLSFFALSSAASAGALYQSKSCNAHGSSEVQFSSGCYFDGFFPGGTNAQGYCRFGNTSQYSWYPSHRVDTVAWGTTTTLGSWTSARLAYSPVVVTGYSYYQCTPWINSSSTEWRNYNNQLYLGSY